MWLYNITKMTQEPIGKLWVMRVPKCSSHVFNFPFYFMIFFTKWVLPSFRDPAKLILQCSFNYICGVSCLHHLVLHHSSECHCLLHPQSFLGFFQWVLQFKVWWVGSCLNRSVAIFPSASPKLNNGLGSISTFIQAAVGEDAIGTHATWPSILVLKLLSIGANQVTAGRITHLTQGLATSIYIPAKTGKTKLLKAHGKKRIAIFWSRQGIHMVQWIYEICNKKLMSQRWKTSRAIQSAPWILIRYKDFLKSKLQSIDHIED